MFRLVAERRRRGRALWASVLAALTVTAVTVSEASAGVEKTFSWGLDRIDQQALPLNSKYSHRYTGAGVDVYVLSSGLRFTSGEFFFNSRARAGGAFTWGDGWADRDCEGRGTHVASTAGGMTWGVADESSIISVKVYQCPGELASPGLMGEQVEWVVDDHAAGMPAVAVLDMAVDRTTGSDTEMTVYDDLAKAMIDDGITVVVPAGDKADVAACDQSPARVPRAITVAATTSTDERASSSSSGSCIDLFAPGVDVRTGRHDDDLASTLASGTSMAAAHVAGAAALILEEHPSYTPAQVWDAIKADATTGVITGLNTGEPDRLLQVTPAALPGAPEGLTGAVAPTDGMPSGYVKLTWALPADDGGAEIIGYRVQDSTDGKTWRDLSDSQDGIRVYHTGGFATGTPRWFRVAAKNAVGVGPWTTSVQLTPLGVPSDVTGLTAAVAPAPGVGAGEVDLSWAAPADDGGTAVTDYVIQYRRLDSTTYTTVDDGVSAATSFTLGGLTKGVRYVVRVSASNLVGVGTGTILTATPAGSPDAPVGLTAAAAPAAGVGSGEVKLAWTAPASNGVPIDDYIITKAIGNGPTTVVNDGVSTATTLTVGGLTNGTNHTFTVWAKNSLGTSPTAAAITAMPIWNPEAPGGLRANVAPAAGVGSGQVQLIWNAPDGSPATDYLIERSEDGVNWTTVDDTVSPETAFTVDGLRNGTRYRFQVTAKNDVGFGPPSAEVSATPVWVPAAPDGLTAAVAPTDGVGSGEVGLDWNAPASNGAEITDYLIESSTDGTTWTAVDDAVSDATTHAVGGLANGTAYSFRVTARNVVGNGSASDEIQAVPVWVPAAPAGLTAVRGRSGEVKLGWAAPADNGSAITDYAIESSVDGTTWTAVDDGVSMETKTTVGGLANGTEYQFRISAGNSVGRGPWSDVIEATPKWSPAAPRRPRAAVAPAAGVRTREVKLTWTAPANNGAAISDYVIQRSLDGTTWRTVRDGKSTSTTFTVRWLTNGKQYRFRVAATNALGRSKWSPTVVAVPRWKPAAPTGLRAAAAGSGRVLLRWSAPAANGAAIRDYVIQRSTGRRWFTVRDGVSTARSSTVTGLANDTSYRFRVAAKNAVGQGGWSAAVRTTPHAR